MDSKTIISHKSNTSIIWRVFILLTLITAVEVFLGFYKPEILIQNSFLHLSLLNIIFIVLTIFKAYFIMWSFMHLKGEKMSFRLSVVGVLIFYVLFLVILVLIDGEYVFYVLNNSTYNWNF